MPNGVYGPCTTDVKPHGATSGPRFAHLLTLWLAPSSLHAQIDTWCRGRQTGGLSAPRLQRCGPAVSRLIQSNLPLSQAGAAGCSPSSSRLEAQQTTQLSSAVQTARREGGGALLVKLVSTKSLVNEVELSPTAYRLAPMSTETWVTCCEPQNCPEASLSGRTPPNGRLTWPENLLL